MRLLAAEHITHAFGAAPLLQDVTLQVDEKDKIGLIGVNGTGKSTLLRCLAGEQTPDKGTVFCRPGTRVALLPQNPVFDEKATVLEQVLQSAGAQAQQETFRAKTLLTKLGVTAFEEKVAHLSGGEKKRLALAAVLACPSDALILDEPTNHLDDGMIDWLEVQLQAYQGALVMVTHDRYFLDRVTSSIAEIDHGRLYRYEGNYEEYLRRKTERAQSALASERKRQSLLRKELAWLQRGARARGTKSRERIERIQTLQGAAAPPGDAALEVESLATRLGKKIVEAHGVSKRFGERVILEDFSTVLLPRDRVGIVGANGSGKSTLLKLLAGRIEPDSGEVVRGETVKIGYFSQESEELDPDKRAIDVVRGIAEDVHTKTGVVTASQMLERFLFSPERQYTQVKKLSGGERRRLLLLCVLMGSPNVLLMDEPTNDLDIQTLQVLEGYLDTFQGAVVTVSHDRYFLDRVTEKLLAMQGDGQVQAVMGGYQAYAAKARAQKQRRDKAPEKAAPARPGPKKKTKFSYQEQREYDTIEADIEALEQQARQILRQIERSASDYQALEELTRKQQALQAALEAKLDRWAVLTERVEQMQRL